MAGKYAALRGKLPAFEEEFSYQQKVDEEKSRLCNEPDNPEDLNVSRFASFLASEKAAKEKLEEEISEHNVRIEALSQLLVAALEDQQIQKVELASGAVCYIQDTPYPRVSDKDALMAWLKQRKMQSLLTLNAQTLKGIVNDLLVAGKPAPSGVEVFLKTQVRIRNSKNGDEQ